MNYSKKRKKNKTKKKLRPKNNRKLNNLSAK